MDLKLLQTEEQLLWLTTSSTLATFVVSLTHSSLSTVQGAILKNLPTYIKYFIIYKCTPGNRFSEITNCKAAAAAIAGHGGIHTFTSVKSDLQNVFIQNEEVHRSTFTAAAAMTQHTKVSITSQKGATAAHINKREQTQERMENIHQ
eukprot:11975408-Ditylum_brightwellii.AAC.1